MYFNNYNKSSWFPLKNFTKSDIHYDWTMGSTKFSNCKDAIYPTKKISKYETVFWNRSLGNVCIALSSYEDAVKNNDTMALEKMKSLRLPPDIRIN